MVEIQIGQSGLYENSLQLSGHFDSAGHRHTQKTDRNDQHMFSLEKVPAVLTVIPQLSL